MHTDILVVLVLAALSRDNAPIYKDVLIRDVPHVQQKPDFCGEACTEMIFRKLGSKLTQDDVFNSSGLNPESGRGCYTRELSVALKALGFKTGDVFYKVRASSAAADMEQQWKAVHDDLLRGVPSIVCTHFSDRPDTTEHFRLVLGYAAATDEVIYNEPAEKDGAYRRMKRDAFIKLWPLQYDQQWWTAIRLRLEVQKLASPPPVQGFTAADYAQHVIALREKLPNASFAIVVQPPFVVIGDEDAAMVRLRAEQTVKWAVDKLKQDFFTKDPADILDVWLFRGKLSYERNAKALFNDKPSTPYGYYSAENKALVMNIATGGGTLVHEIVHPFMRTNFPACPDWLNEGLGSLYEQASARDGHIIGLTNWRLAKLQDAIKAGDVPPFEDLTGVTGKQFYGDDPGTNYAQARYLCYYLQEKGLLVKFYREFVANQKEDPTGFKTLKKILGEDDMAAFKKKWEAYVMKLRFGG